MTRTRDIAGGTIFTGADHTKLDGIATDEWRTYRQALRDLPAQSGFPDVNFPTPPS